MIVTLSYGLSQHEPCLVKTGLKIFVTFIPKEGLACTSPAKLSFGMPLDYKIVLGYLHKLYFMVGAIPKQVWMDQCQPRLLLTSASEDFFWYDKDKDLKACFA